MKFYFPRADLMCFLEKAYVMVKVLDMCNMFCQFYFFFCGSYINCANADVMFWLNLLFLVRCLFGTQRLPDLFSPDVRATEFVCLI